MSERRKRHQTPGAGVVSKRKMTFFKGELLSGGPPHGLSGAERDRQVFSDFSFTGLCRRGVPP